MRTSVDMMANRSGRRGGGSYGGGNSGGGYGGGSRSGHGGRGQRASWVRKFSRPCWPISATWRCTAGAAPPPCSTPAAVSPGGLCVQHRPGGFPPRWTSATSPCTTIKVAVARRRSALSTWRQLIVSPAARRAGAPFRVISARCRRPFACVLQPGQGGWNCRWPAWGTPAWSSPGPRSSTVTAPHSISPVVRAKAGPATARLASPIDSANYRAIKASDIARAVIKAVQASTPGVVTLMSGDAGG